MKSTLCLLVAGLLSACTEPSTSHTTVASTGGKITICHKGHTIQVAASAWKGHRAHADTTGPCGGGCAATPGALTIVDFRADQGVTTDASGRVVSWADNSGNSLAAESTFGPVAMTDAGGRSVLRFANDGNLIAPPQLPASGTVFIVYGGRDGADASNVPIGWGESAFGAHGVDLLLIPGFGVDAVFRNNSEIGDLLIEPNATTMEVDTLSWGPAGLLFERRLADGTSLTCTPGGAGCLSYSNLTALSGGGYELHIGSSGDGGLRFDGDLAQLIINDHQLNACERQATVDLLAQRWLIPLPPPVEFVTFPTSAHPTNVAIADLNSDGKPDLAITSATLDLVSIFFNTTPVGATTPTFAASVDLVTPQVPINVAFADFNDDGKPDLAVANNNSASVFLNTTNSGAAVPRFADRVDVPVTGNPTSISLGDVNADGKPDLVIPTTFNLIAVTLNATAPGAATASFEAETTFGTDIQPGTVAIGDLDGDGRPELSVTSSFSGTVSLLVNTTAAGASTPTFAAKVDFAAPSPGAVAVSDINRDGWLDLVVSTSGGQSILLNTTTAGGALSLSAREDFAGTSALPVIADFNNDGVGDIAAMNGAVVSLFINTTAPGATTSSLAPSIDYSLAPSAVGFATGDLDGNGQLDLVVTNQDQFTFSVLLRP